MAQRVININLNKWHVWICVLLVGINFFTKFPFLTTRDLSWDEPFSAFYSQFGVAQIITELFKGNNPPLYELFLHFYTAIFGLSEFALRMPSVLFSCGTVAFLFYAGRRLRGNWTGVYVALLFIFNNLQFFYSLAARMYALFSLFVAASLYLSIVSFQEPEKKKYCYWLLTVNVMMCYTHYFAGFVIVAEAMAWLVTFRNKLFFKRMFLVFLANTILVIPLLIVFRQRAEGFVNTTVFKPPTPEIWKNVIMNLINGMYVYEACYTSLFFGMIIYLLSAAIRRKIEFRNIYFFVLLFTLFALPLSLTWYFANTYPLFSDRYYLYTTIPLFLFFALCIHTFYRPLGIIWAPVFFIYLFNIYHRDSIRLDNDYMLREWQGATLTAKQLQHQKPNSIVLIHPLWADLGFSYYYNRSLYDSPQNYNNRLRDAGVYRLWGSDSLYQILRFNKGHPVIYYCDESGKVDSTNDGNYRMLLRFGYVKDTTYFFPVCTNVISMHMPDSLTAK